MDPFSLAGLLTGAGSVFGNVLGGIFGNSAQDKANQTNLQIARETNQMNRQMFDDQLAYNWKMFDAANQWNSAVNQRKLLEQAGYNPAELNPGSTAQPMTAPSGHAAQTGAPMQPKMALANNVAKSIGDAAQVASFMANARKTDAEAKNTEIKNVTEGAMNSAQLRGMNLDNDAKVLDNIYKDETLIPRIAQEHKQLAQLDANTKNIISQTALNNIRYELEQENIKLTQLEQDKVQELIKNAIEEGKNIITQRDLIKAGISEAHSRTAFNIVQAEMARVVGNSQAAANYATAQNQYSQAAANNLETQLRKKYGDLKEISSILNQVSSTTLNASQAQKVFREIKLLDKKIKWEDYDRFLKVVQTVGGLAGVAMLCI